MSFSSIALHWPDPEQVTQSDPFIVMGQVGISHVRPVNPAVHMQVFDKVQEPPLRQRGHDVLGPMMGGSEISSVGGGSTGDKMGNSPDDGEIDGTFDGIIDGEFEDITDGVFEDITDGEFDDIDTGTANGATNSNVGEVSNESSNGDTAGTAACSRSASLSFMNDRYEFIAPSSVMKLEKSLKYLSYNVVTLPRFHLSSKTTRACSETEKWV
mmetsp:Transcript_7141/g.10765  ORF Transcript_7141/g.10765 Transcript_7141/m.10765 type:complete len:212 (+) Transcript_7141:938-1573(+)